MCQFICTIHEAYLADRKLQIAYVKKRSKTLSKITWQDHKPFNLYNYHYNKAPYNLPYRIQNKLKRIVKESFGNPYVQRNGELQFLGHKNNEQLSCYLLNKNLEDLIPKSLTEEFSTILSKVIASNIRIH